MRESSFTGNEHNKRGEKILQMQRYDITLQKEGKDQHVDLMMLQVQGRRYGRRQVRLKTPKSGLQSPSKIHSLHTKLVSLEK